MRDEAFICSVCGLSVEPLKYTARDHCPKCLHSIHVDINPGDRQCECRGILAPIGVEKYKNSFKIVYRCERCNSIRKNVAAKDDNTDLIIELSSHPLNI